MAIKKNRVLMQPNDYFRLASDCRLMAAMARLELDLEGALHWNSRAAYYAQLARGSSHG